DDWSKLGCLKNDFPTAPLLLFTATCFQQTAKYIQENLCCSNLNIVMIQ
ncbi:5469_t:CDS:1, partial [Funneliformis geosporum]